VTRRDEERLRQIRTGTRLRRLGINAEYRIHVDRELPRERLVRDSRPVAAWEYAAQQRAHANGRLVRFNVGEILRVH
jgi:hypothetical protein